ncbi:unnamed protein product [Acanthoscelides obtectus]|uniref:Uncharacterized protein n=1 Tax=Acanthoscelides obtectus TaxID=200917 RepID=A0A9P0K2N0_ACAOB|nr:unnamed protein product [Acanthoscelides obtectus]CAK1620216.1 hypothetical protein AOBTE_LOCUS245 [Acanthoscelides obtectus]
MTYCRVSFEFRLYCYLTGYGRNRQAS